MRPEENKNQNRRSFLLKQVERLVGEGKSIRDACAQVNVPRSQFYKWRSRRDEDPVNGLYDLSRRAPDHSSNVSLTERKRICELSLQFPKEGCDRLKVRLEREGITRSSTTIQEVLRQNGLENIGLRQWQKNRQLKQLIQGKRRQLQQLPRRRARSQRARLYESQRALLNPGESFFQGFYKVVIPEGLVKSGRSDGLYLHFIFDFATELVWFDLKWSWNPISLPSARDVTDLLQSGVVEAFKQKDIAINSIMTSNQSAFVERKSFPRPGTNGPDHPLEYSREVGLLGLRHIIIKKETAEVKAVIAYVLERLQAEFPDQITLTYFIDPTKA